MSDIPVPWEQLTTAALLGTARGTVPTWPGLGERAGAGPEERLLDAAAVAGALRRAGRRPLPAADPAGPPAPDDVHPPAPEPAARLLELVLVQPPAGRRLQPALLAAWAEEARRRGRRAPHHSLVPLLSAATADPDLRPAVRSVLDRRGCWLAAQRDEWAWALPTAADDVPDGVGAAAGDPEEWARRPTPERVAALAVLRRRDPDAARALLATTWSSDPAPARTDLLGALRTGLSEADEPLLEASLDDRSARVRETARDLLDRLPGSRRAQRLGLLLAPLLDVRRRRVRVELPHSPDAQAVRDGLVPGPRGRSERAWWLQVLARGAPLETWTATTGLSPERVLDTLDEPTAADGLRAATTLRRDVTWARAHLRRGWEPAMVALLPAAEGRAVVLDRVGRVATLDELAGALVLLDGPWSADEGRRVLRRLQALPTGATDHRDLTVVLATRLPAEAAPEVARLAARDTPLHDTLHRVAHHLSFLPTIQESFA